MADKHTFTVTGRTLTGRHVKKLRREGSTPGNIFGKKIPSLNVQVSTKDFLRLYKEVGESTLVYLQVKGEKDTRPVLINMVTLHPVTSIPVHVTFHQVDLKEKVTAPVPLLISGDAPAEKEKLGILVQQLGELEIEALPTDMPENIGVDVSKLSAVGDSILVKDIQVNSKLTIKTDPESMIVKIEPLAAEEKVEAPVVPAEGEAPAASPTEGEALVTYETKEESKSE